MRRRLAITVAVLIVAQAVSAAVPRLHVPAPPKESHHPRAHDCCPKPVVQVRDCCPKTVACPHQHHSAGACCCTASNNTGVPSRKAVRGSDAPRAVEFVINPMTNRTEEILSHPTPNPLDNSPPVLPLRN